MSKQLQFGIIGAGHIAHTFVNAIQQIPEANLLGVASSTAEKAEVFAHTYHIPRFYADYMSLLSDPEIDVVYISTPHVSHYEMTLACLAHKKAVIVEKPMGINNTEVRRMCDVAKNQNTFLMEAMWTRFLPSIEEATKRIRAGEIGEIRHIQADFGFVAPYEPTNRFFNPDLCGGALLDVGVYPVFLSLLLLGKPFRSNCAAVIGFTGVDESCSISFSYQNGSTASLYASLVVDTDRKATIYGSKGKMVLQEPWYGVTKLLMQKENEPMIEVPLEMHSNGFIYEIKEAIKCIQEGKIESPKYNHHFSYELVQVIDGLRRQCRLSYPKEQLVISV